MVERGGRWWTQLAFLSSRIKKRWVVDAVGVSLYSSGKCHMTFAFFGLLALRKGKNGKKKAQIFAYKILHKIAFLV